MNEIRMGKKVQKMLQPYLKKEIKVSIEPNILNGEIISYHIDIITSDSMVVSGTINELKFKMAFENAMQECRNFGLL